MSQSVHACTRGSGGWRLGLTVSAAAPAITDHRDHQRVSSPPMYTSHTSFTLWVSCSSWCEVGRGKGGGPIGVVASLRREGTGAPHSPWYFASEPLCLGPLICLPIW